jgi:superoxide oxidase
MTLAAGIALTADGRRPPFDNVTIFFHWATVLIVLAMFTSAWLISQSQDVVVTSVLLQIHRSLGVTIWFTTAFRIAWRLTNAKLPSFPDAMTAAHRTVVRWSEIGLYALLLVQPSTGMGATLFSGRPFDLFLWRIAPLVQQDKALRATFHLAHELGAWALASLIAGHALAALIHHFILRDDVLECMAPVITTMRRPEEFRADGVIGEGSIQAR